MPSEFPLPPSTPAALNLRARPLADLDKLIRTHIEDMRYPGCQIAIARHGQLALYRTYGLARVEPEEVAAVDDTLWLLFSNTKVLTMAAVWSLVEEGSLSFNDRVVDHIRNSPPTARVRSRCSIWRRIRPGSRAPMSAATAGLTTPACAPRSATSVRNGPPGQSSSITAAAPI